MKSLTRGGQTISQDFSLFGQVFSYLLAIGILTFILIFSVWMYYKVTKDDLYNSYKLYETKFGLWSNDKLGASWFTTTNYHNKKVNIRLLHDSLQHSSSVNTIISSFKQSLIVGLIFTVIVLIVNIKYLAIKGAKVVGGKYLKGAKLVEPSELIKIIKRQHKASKINIAGIPLVGNSERQHIAIYGSTGTGKTQIFLNLMSQIIKNGDRFIAYDYCREFIPKFYQPQQDVILNFFDARCPYWDPWLECKKRADFDAIAESLMPEQANARDPFWVLAARIVFAATCYKLGLEENPTIPRLLKLLLTVDNGYIKELLKNTEAEILVHETQDKLALSVKAMLATYLRSFQYLPETGTKFSIRDWVLSNKPGSVFIATNPRQENSMRPLITTILDQASISAQEIPIYPDRELYFLLEERHRLGKLASSISTKALARKHGLCFVSGWQSPAQQKAIYGQHDFEAMADLVNTTAILRMKGRVSAKYLSDSLGEQEVEITNEAMSYGLTDNRSGINYAKHIQTRPLVLPSEIQLLNDLEGYLSLKGNLPVAKIKLTPQDYSEIEQAFIPRDVKPNMEVYELMTTSINQATSCGIQVPKEPEYLITGATIQDDMEEYNLI